MDQIQKILDIHNDGRNRIANGSIDPFPPALRMAKMCWSKQLAKLAELNTRQCEMKHDGCRNTSEFLM